MPVDTCKGRQPSNQWRKPGAEFGGRKNFSRTKMTFFLKKISILMTTIFDDLFLVIDQVFQISPPFSLIFRIFTLLNIVHNPFLTRKIAYLFLLFSYSAADVKSHQTR